MPSLYPPARAGRLLLGPIVGHTNHHSTRIWIRVRDDPSTYYLRVTGHGIFRFHSTEAPSKPEFGTAIAVADGLRPDWKYRYQVLKNGRVVARSRGTFRTMPLPGSQADMLFVSLSCSHREEPGAWQLLDDYVNKDGPRFLLMLGDQVYLDQGDNVWEQHLDSAPSKRRRAMADKYQEHWSWEPIRSLMANTPTYMIWDDHEIRDGWGSWAEDSPTLARRYPRGAKITDAYERFMMDARDVYWHFQMSRNPQGQPQPLPAEPGTNRFAIPYWFQCGRLAVLVLDGRGARDVFREKDPILGSAQWQFIKDFIDKLPSDIDALAVVTPAPIVSMDPEGLSQRSLGGRMDDVELYRQGRAKELLQLHRGLDDSGWAQAKAVMSEYIPILPREISDFKIEDLDDIRDQWAHKWSRPEQARLIREVDRSTRVNRLPSQPRSVMFLGGDIHVGAHFEISIGNSRIPCLVSSAISQGPPPLHLLKNVGVLVDEKFSVADGISAQLKTFVRANNFCVTQATFTRSVPSMISTLAHEGDADYWSTELPLSARGVLGI